MNTGWNIIKNIWYFLSPENNVERTLRYNESTNKWDYVGNSSVRPLGSMYENERTPDNYYVDGNGAWIEGRQRAIKVKLAQRNLGEFLFGYNKKVLCVKRK